MEFVFKKLPKKEISRPRWSHYRILSDIYHSSKRWINTNFTQSLPENKRGRTTSNSFYEVSINIIPTPDKDITKKEIPYQYLSISKDTEWTFNKIIYIHDKNSEQTKKREELL